MAMASTSKHPSFFLLLLLVLSSVQVEARVNKFFSKFIHTDHNDVPQLLTPSLPVAPSPAPVSASPEISPILAPTPAPAPFFDETQNAYGLYGRDSDDTENSPTLTDVEEEILAEDGGDESYKSGYSKTNLVGDKYGSPRKYEQYQSNYENNGYRNSEYQSNYENNGYRNSEYENNEYRNSEFENNGYRNSESDNNRYNENNGFRKNRYAPTERQGMSDTRFMENGKYYYEANSRNGGEGDSNGSKKYPNEFDSMEEYEKSEGFLP